MLRPFQAATILVEAGLELAGISSVFDVFVARRTQVIAPLRGRIADVPVPSTKADVLQLNELPESVRTNRVDEWPSRVTLWVFMGATYAVLVAVENYQQKTIKGVDFAVADAEAMQSVLIQQLQVPSENIKLWTNQQATRSAFEEDLKYELRLSSTLSICDGCSDQL